MKDKHSVRIIIAKQKSLKNLIHRNTERMERIASFDINDPLVQSIKDQIISWMDELDYWENDVEHN